MTSVAPASSSIRYLVASLAIAAAVGIPAEASDRPAFLGTLELGPHAVGYRVEWLLDRGRAYDMAFDDGSRYAKDGDRPRPVLAQSWYPAAADLSASRMPHRGYFDIVSDDPRLTTLSRGLRDYALGIVADYILLVDEEDRTDEDLAALERWLDTVTASVRDASPAEGRFPVVLYHSGFGSSFEDNAVLCEYLASHGYVVMGSAYLDGQGESFNIDSREASSRDLECLIRHAATLPQADTTALAMVGHSGGAHATLWFAAQEACPLDALVCLDTTQDYHPLSNPLWDSMVDRALEWVPHIDQPLLMVAEPHAIFDLADRLIQADRTYLTIPRMNHDTFISQGILHAELAATRGRIPFEEPDGPGAAEVRTGYEQVCRYVLAFLDAHLSRDASALDELDDRYAGHRPGAAPTVERVGRDIDGRRRAARSPADWGPRDVRLSWKARGVPATVESLRELHASEPSSPIFTHAFAFALLYELSVDGQHDAIGPLSTFYAELDIDVLPSAVAQAKFYGRIASGSESRLGHARNSMNLASRLGATDAAMEEIRAAIASGSSDG